MKQLIRKKESFAKSVTIRLRRGAKSFRNNWQLHLLIALPIIYMLIFYYYPIYGAQIAFRNYRARDGITGSEWVGLQWFIKFFTNYKFQDVLLNTLRLSFYSLITFPLPIFLALLINALPNQRFQKAVKTVSYLPHFLSIVILVSVMEFVLSPVNGPYGVFYRLFGGEGIPMDIRGSADAFPHLYVWSGVWQNLGWDTIIYTAALASVSQDHHEAAMLDGASRFQRVIHVDLPTILPTVSIMLIMRCGHIMSMGFEKAYLMQYPTNTMVSEIISTYVYKVGMGKTSDMSYAAAIGLFNSVVNCILLVFVNWLSKRASEEENSLF